MGSGPRLTLIISTSEFCKNSQVIRIVDKHVILVRNLNRAKYSKFLESEDLYMATPLSDFLQVRNSFQEEAILALIWNWTKVSTFFVILGALYVGAGPL